MGFNFGSFAGGAAQGFMKSYEMFKEQERRDELAKIEKAKEGRAAEEGARVSAGMQRAGEVEPVGAPVYGSPMEAYRSQGAGAEQAAALAAQEGTAFGGKTQAGTLGGLRSTLPADAPMPPSKPQTVGGYQMGMAGALAGTTPQATLEAAKLAGTAGEQFKKEEVEGMLKNFNTMRTHVVGLGQQLVDEKINMREYVEKSAPYYATLPNAMSVAYRAPTDDTPEMVGLRDDKTGAVKQWIPVNKDTVGQIVTAADTHMRDAFRNTLGSTSLDAWRIVDEHDLKKGKLDVDKAAQESLAASQKSQADYHKKQGDYIDAQIKSGNWGMEAYHNAAAQHQRDSATRERKLEVEQRDAAKTAKDAAEKYKDNPTSENLRSFNIAQEQFLNLQGKGGLLQDEFANDRKFIDTQAANMAKNASPEDMPKITAWRDAELQKLTAHVGGIDTFRQFVRGNADNLPAQVIDQAMTKPSKEWKTDKDGRTTVTVGKHDITVPQKIVDAVRAREAAANAPKGGPVANAAATATGAVPGAPPLPPGAEDRGAQVDRLRTQLAAAKQAVTMRAKADKTFDAKNRRVEELEAELQNALAGYQSSLGAPGAARVYQKP